MIISIMRFKRLSLSGYTSVEGMHFSGQGKATFYISTSVLDNYANAGVGGKYFDLFSIPAVLGLPVVVFQGLKREDQAESLCYAGIPAKRYLSAEITVPPKPGRAFAVYMNNELKIFDWRWEISDESKPGYPLEWATRYETTLWPPP
jgi:hypothetical protein